MTQSELNRAVARATGESYSTIRRMGFSIFAPEEAQDELDSLPQPQTVDWDQLDSQRLAFLPQRTGGHRNPA